MLSNELRKGDRVVMAGTGWNATIMDNAKGNIRIADVEGFFREMGSVYVWDIAYKVNADGTHEYIDLTPKQEKDRGNVRGFMSSIL